MMTAAQRRDRWLSAVEVTLVTLLLAAQIWLAWTWLPVSESLQRVARVGSIVLLVAVIVASFLRVRDSWRDLGLSLHCMKQGWVSIAVFTAIGLAGLIVADVLIPQEQRGSLNFAWLLTYSHGMLGQQLGLQLVLNNRVHRALGGMNEPTRTTVTVIICTIVFTLLHAPNPGLMIVVIPASVLWCWHFRKFHNLPALLCSHFILGGAAMVLLGDGPLLRLRIGPPALRMLELG